MRTLGLLLMALRLSVPASAELIQQFAIRATGAVLPETPDSPGVLHSAIVLPQFSQSYGKLIAADLLIDGHYYVKYLMSNPTAVPMTMAGYVDAIVTINGQQTRYQGGEGYEPLDPYTQKLAWPSVHFTHYHNLLSNPQIFGTGTFSLPYSVSAAPSYGASGYVNGAGVTGGRTYLGTFGNSTFTAPAQLSFTLMYAYIPVPEPSSYLLFGTAAAALWVGARRRYWRFRL
jgi:PEP-CTERM motif